MHVDNSDEDRITKGQTIIRHKAENSRQSPKPSACLPQKPSLQEQPGRGRCLLSAAVQCSQSHVENQKSVQHGLLSSVCVFTFVGVSDSQGGFGVTESPDGYKHPTAKCVSRRERGMGGSLQHFLQPGSMALDSPTPPVVL